MSTGLSTGNGHEMTCCPFTETALKACVSKTLTDSSCLVDVGNYINYSRNRRLLNSLKWLKNGSDNCNLRYRLEVKFFRTGNRNSECKALSSLLVETQNSHLLPAWLNVVV